MDEPNGNLTPSLEIIQDSRYIICLSKKFRGLGTDFRTVEVFTLPGNNLEYRVARTKTGKRKKLK